MRRFKRLKYLRDLAVEGSSEDFENKKAEIAALELTMPPLPSIPCLWTQDVTPEKLATLMYENDERMAIISDEGGLFDILAGRYSAGVPNLDLFLQSHAGSPVRVHRGTRPAVIMERPLLTIALSPQPDVLRSLTDKPGFRGRGLLARFLYMLPPSTLGYRPNRSHSIPESVIEDYRSGIYALLSMRPDAKALGLTLSEEAYSEWTDFRHLVERGLREGGGFEHMTDWAGKLPGIVIRLAGLWHCAEHADGKHWNTEISADTMRRVLMASTVFSVHAKAAFDLMAADPTLEDARKVWRSIERKRRRSFTARDCFQDVKGRFPRMEGLEPAIKVLVERFYIFAAPLKPGPGRPSPSYTVNPSLTEGWA